RAGHRWRGRPDLVAPLRGRGRPAMARAGRHHASSGPHGMTVLPVHIVAGALGILSGTLALYAVKGAGLHRKSGTVFVAAMLVMAATGALLAALGANW